MNFEIFLLYPQRSPSYYATRMKDRSFSGLTIIGAGHWGRALGGLVESKGISVTYLDLPHSVEDWKQALTRSQLVLITTPFKAIEDVLEKLAGIELAGVVNASKGIDRKTLKTFSNLVGKKLKCPIASLSGPTFAKEVSEKRPTACVIASKNLAFARKVAEFFSSTFFRAYTNSDPVGVEVCGALKNVLAIACGISDGMQVGLNARAALLTRGLKEMETLVKVMGGKATTIYGLAGVGDLWLTATGDLSRNRQLGLKLAKGETLDLAASHLEGPAEGLYTVLQVHELAKKKKLDLPICEQVYRICTNSQKPTDAIRALMTRDLTSEESSSSTRRRTGPSTL